MYKILVLTSSILFFTALANAQEAPSNKIIRQFELVAGPSFSNNSGYLPEYNSTVGYSFGIGYYQKIYKSFSLNARSLYEMKGSETTYSYGSVDANGFVETNNKFTTKLKYLTFYVLPTLQLGRNKNIQLSAGGYYSFLQNLSVNSYRTRQDNGEFIGEYTDTNKNYFSPKYDGGVSFQVGYSFNVSSKTQLMLQAYSNWGLVDLNNRFIGSQRNNNLGVLLSWKLR